MREEAPAPEKTAIDIRFIPIACAAPLLYAQTHGFFEKNGLSVRLRTAPGWSGIKELLVHDQVDAAHMLTPMPLACSLGIDGRPAELRLCAIQNVNGGALILASRHAEIQHVRDMKGLVFGVPYAFSMQYYLLCDLLAKHGLDPRSDVTIQEVVPPCMPYYLKKGWLDGILSPEPYGELAVEQGAGFIYMLSREIWPGHPCCALGTTRRFVEAFPGTYRAMMRSVLEAEHALHVADRQERARIAAEISALTPWGDKGIRAIQRVLAGLYTDRRGQERVVEDRIDFVPYPFREYGDWVVSQMQRREQLGREVDGRAAVEAVFLEESTEQLARSMGLPALRPSIDRIPRVPPDTDAPGAGPDAAPARSPAPPGQGYDLSPATRERLSEILTWIASVAGGEPHAPLEVTSRDEIGWLEQMLNEAVRNLRFAREAHDERLELEAQARRQQDVIDAQQRLIQELSTPIIPVLEGVLVLPLVGSIDRDRAQRILEALLAEVTRTGARTVLVDITGVPHMDDVALSYLLRVTRSASLLGAESILVGVSPALARHLAELGEGLRLPPTRANLRSGIEYALRRAGLQITPAPRPPRAP